MTSELFVWIYLPGATTPVVAGRIRTRSSAAGVAVGDFVYGKSYLARAEAITIDPATLPLQEGIFEFTTLNGYPGAIIDACPDRWGIRVIDRLRGAQAYPDGYLLINDPGRTGALAFSTSSEDIPQELKSREFPLELLLHAAEAIEADKPVDPEILKALHPGTGGARPKCNVVDSDGVWIAKFPSASDDPLISIPRLEHATMVLARACGVEAAETRLRVVDGKDVCLVRRFDRMLDANNQTTRKGFVSARSVFYADPAFASLGTGSYARLARWFARYNAPAAQRAQLYRRMVFNCAVRNTDDHDLNHGLVQLPNGSFELAPAYDIVPSLKLNVVNHHALIIGETAAGNIWNLLSNTTAFGLSREEAIDIINEVQRTIHERWQEIFYEAGFGDEGLRRIERCFSPLPAA